MNKKKDEYKVIEHYDDKKTLTVVLCCIFGLISFALCFINIFFIIPFIICIVCAFVIN